MTFSRNSVCSLVVMGAATFAAQAAPTPAAQAAGAEADVERIEVVGSRQDDRSEPTQEALELLSVAGTMGDPISSVYTLPGVVMAGGDAGGEPAVRGSAPEDNLYLMDGLPTGPIFHLFGDSIYNENLIQDFGFEASGFGPAYGQAIGGLFDVRLRDPRHQDFGGVIDLSFLKAGVLVESEIDERQAFYFSYRRSLIEYFLPEDEEVEDGVTVYQPPQSADYQMKYQWRPNTRTTVDLALIGATDSGELDIAEDSVVAQTDPDLLGKMTLDNGFDGQSLNYEYRAEQGAVVNLRYGHLAKDTDVGYGAGQYINTETEDHNIRLSYSRPLGASHRLLVGSDLDLSTVDYRYDFIPYYCTDSQSDCEAQKGERVSDAQSKSVNLYAGYIEDQWQLGEDWLWAYGVRLEHNSASGENFVHPRTRLEWQTTSKLLTVIKAGRYSQPPTIDKSIDVIGNPNLDSPVSDHVSLGFEYQFAANWFFSDEIYYKSIRQLPLAVALSEDSEAIRYTNDLSGDAYGIELMIQRRAYDAWNGWASLSWSETSRTNDLTGEEVAYYLDTPLIANLVVNYRLNDRWDFGTKATLRSGARYTEIVGLRPNEDYPGYYLPVYGENNGETLPYYFRLDVEANYSGRFLGYEAIYTLAALNLTNRENISGYSYEPDSTDRSQLVIKGDEELGFFPYLGMKVSF